jgi:hypothetical protein
MLTSGIFKENVDSLRKFSGLWALSWDAEGLTERVLAMQDSGQDLGGRNM